MYELGRNRKFSQVAKCSESTNSKQQIITDENSKQQIITIENFFGGKVHPTHGWEKLQAATQGLQLTRGCQVFLNK